jgi:hypothetical protein
MEDDMSNYNNDRPDWDNQFAETVEERNERLAARRKARLIYDKDKRTIVNSSDPAKTGMFVLHRCWKCNDGELACVVGSPRQCEYPHARND